MQSTIRFIPSTSLLAGILFLHASPALADYTVSGKFLYQDRAFNASGFTGAINSRPIRFADVQIMAGTDVLAKGATTADGTFSIVVPGSVVQSIKAVCYASSTRTPGLLMEVRSTTGSFTFGSIYSLSSAAVNYQGTPILDMGDTTASTTIDSGKVFNIWDVAYDGMEFVASSGVNGARPTTMLTFLFRSGVSTASFYSGSGTSKFAYIGSTSGYDDTVIAHQFGHFVADTFSKLDNPLQLPDFGVADDDIRVAWAEGVGMFIGASIRKFKGYPHPEVYVVTDGNNLLFSVDIESLGANVPLTSTKGSTNTLAVCAALWDITDGPDTNDATPGVDDDPLQRPFSDVWKVLTGPMRTSTQAGISVEDFWDGWFSPAISNGSLAEMQTIFATLNGIEFISDTLESDNTSATAPSVVPAPFSPSSGAKVLINEVYVGGSDVVELINAGDTEADLTGWTITATRSGSIPAFIEIPAFRLRPGAFVTISEGKPGVSRSALFFDVSIPWESGMDGACALRDATGMGQDFVRWGTSKEFPPGGTTFSGPNPSSPVAGKSLGRTFAAVDTNAGADWTEQDPSLGTFNASGQGRHHTYYPAGDVDYVAFNAAAGHSYVLETLNLTCAADTVLELLSMDGTTVLAMSDDHGPTKASRIVWSATASGRFLLRSRRYDGSTNYARYGAYDLQIIESASPLPLEQPDLLTVSSTGQPGTYQTMADAIAAAGQGDTIQIIDSGTYLESLTITDKSVTLKAAGGQNPVLDGRGSKGVPALALTDIKMVNVEGLTVYGGLRGIELDSGSARFTDTTVRRSSGPASSNFGYLVNGPHASATILNSAAVDTGGVGIGIYGGASVKIINTNVRKNSDGIDISGSGTTGNIVNCTIVGNSRVGVGAFNNAAARVDSSIVRGNTSVDVGHDDTAVSLVVKNSIVTKGGFSGKDGNIDADPKFVNAAADDYHLLKDSPCIDKGDAADPDLPATDADGIPRSLDGNGDGTKVPDMGAYEFVPANVFTSTAVFPQIAVGGPANAEYRTAIYGMNTRSQAAIADLTLTKSDGTPFVVNASGGSGSSFSSPIASGGTMRLETSASGTTAAGYAKFLSNQPIGGSALFKLLAGGKIVSEAGVGLAKSTRDFTVYIDNTNNAYSGYAVANVGNVQASLRLTLRDRNGTTVDSVQMPLPAGQHFAKFAAQAGQFPNTAPAGFEGSIEFSSDQNVAAVALRFDNPQQDVFSTIPVLVDEAATTLYFPQVADGGGYRTNFILVNPGSAATTARLEFYDDQGYALNLPIGGASRSTYEVPLSARGVARFVTDGTSPGISVGWVKVSSPVAVGGSSIFQTLGGGKITSEAGVASSPLASHFTTYVESLGFAESGLAIANPNSQGVTVTLNLRNSDGSVAETTSFTLPPQGHVARFFTQWFPGLYSEFSGTLEVLATVPVSGVALRYDNYEANVFATLPVVAIP